MGEGGEASQRLTLDVGSSKKAAACGVVATPEKLSWAGQWMVYDQKRVEEKAEF